MGKFRLFLATAALALVAACTTIASVPQNERIAAGVTAVTAARSTTDQLLLTHKVTPVEARNLNTQADAIIALLQGLRGSPAGTDTTARITQALAMLTALTNYLNQAKKGSP
jgi:hypothetical protein